MTHITVDQEESWHVCRGHKRWGTKGVRINSAGVYTCVRRGCGPGPRCRSGWLFVDGLLRKPLARGRVCRHPARRSIHDIMGKSLPFHVRRHRRGFIRQPCRMVANPRQKGIPHRCAPLSPDGPNPPRECPSADTSCPPARQVSASDTPDRRRASNACKVIKRRETGPSPRAHEQGAITELPAACAQVIGFSRNNRSDAYIRGMSTACERHGADHTGNAELNSDSCVRVRNDGTHDIDGDVGYNRWRKTSGNPRWRLR